MFDHVIDIRNVNISQESHLEMTPLKFDDSKLCHDTVYRKAFFEFFPRLYYIRTPDDKKIVIFSITTPATIFKLGLF